MMMLTVLPDLLERGAFAPRYQQDIKSPVKGDGKIATPICDVNRVGIVWIGSDPADPKAQLD
jgi:hypothetical protein